MKHPKAIMPDQKITGILFTENLGQIQDQNASHRSDIYFAGHDKGLSFFLRNNGVSYQITQTSDEKQKRSGSLHRRNITTAHKEGTHTIYRLDINWLGCNKGAEVSKDKVLGDVSHYYNTRNGKEVLGVHSYEGAWYHNIYEKTDLHYYSTNGSLKYDFIVQPGGNYRNIRFSVEGAEKIVLREDGSVILRTPFGDIYEGAPKVFQNGKTIAAKWIVNNQELSFEIPSYDRSQTLVIDPVTRLWGTYYGGTNSDSFLAGTVNSTNELLVVGEAGSAAANVLATSGSHQQTFGGAGNDGFIALFNSAGVRQWGTYYGGAGLDEVTGCSFDSNGNIAVAGFCEPASATAMVTGGAFQTTHGGGLSDIFIAKFTSGGTRIWGTLFGGAGMETTANCNFDNAGNIIVAGYTKGSADGIMASAGAHQTNSGGISGSDGFVAKFDPSGQRLWSTLYGGPGDDSFYSSAVSSSGDIYVSGISRSPSTTSIATPGSHQPAYAGNDDAILVKFNGAGVRQWGTYYGGSNTEQSYGVMVDGTGNVIIAGDTRSGTVMATPGSHQPNFGGMTDAFVAKFDANGTRLWGTYYGGSAYDDHYGYSVDGSGNIYISGTTTSATGNAIATLGSWQTTYGGAPSDAFLVMISPAGVRQWGTYYGGNKGESSFCTAEPNGDVYLIGTTSSLTGTVIATASSHQPVYGGGIADGFIAKFGGCSMPAQPVLITPTTNLHICSNIQPTLVVSSPNTAWYNSAVFGSAIAITNTFMPGLLPPGVHPWYAEAFDCQTNPSRVPVSLTVVAIPTLVVSSADSINCVGEMVELTATGALSYSWSNGGTGPLAQVTPTTGTTYSVIGLNGSCTSTATFFQVVNPCTQISELSGTNGEASVFPNPNKGVFYIEHSGPAEAKLINVLGETLWVASLPGGTNELNVPGSKGIYFITLTDLSGTKVFKIVKE